MDILLLISVCVGNFFLLHCRHTGGDRMICPYNGFKECDWENCAARMYVDNPCRSGYQMKVCAIAYNGGTVFGN